MLSGVYLGIAYQIVPRHEGDRSWRWTFYPPIGDGESHSGDHSGDSADAERACMNAIRDFARQSSPGYYGREAMTAHYS